ncbi:isocitrate lyase/PEP mutase family protein [Tepidiforma sp.]|uniref:isocitrate lyase/PEP mutase family protein n=1 Tax=Tepidiforma sp. TaxID=2682230 RepID=UPI00261F69CA|nr:isocitrate lyase/PEP mutase family protein [Tepidiforma sp.]MCX7618204.1 isocitrate lyase/PEP mutase family protein [Tepidiforma sp.]
MSAPGESPGARLRALMEQGLVVAPFVFDGVQARLAEAAGFAAVYMSGFGTAASWGLPDRGLIGLGEMAANAARVAGAVRVPVIADADTGYGNEANVARTVELYERAGVAALHLEDQEWPKRCGFLEGKRAIPAEEMELKVRAAVRARRHPATVIIARTDALAPLGREAAAERARRYFAAGADLVFLDGLKDRETIAWAAAELADVPMVLNSWLLTPAEAAALGYRVYLQLGVMLRHFEEFRRALEELRATGQVALGPGAGVEWITRLLDREDGE